MSNIAERIDVSESAGLLINQWRRAPRMRALTEALLGVIDDHLVKPLGEMEQRGRIESANGMWLDCIGERLDQPRPATHLGNHLLFGFHGSGGVGFDQGAFATVVEELSPRVPVGDEYYRSLLLMRSLALVSSGSAPDMERAVQRAIPGSQYADAGDMTATLHLPAQTPTELMNLLSALDAFPKPAGVSLAVEVPESFAHLIPKKPNESIRADITVGSGAPGTLYDGGTASPTGSATGDLEIEGGLVIERIRWPVPSGLLVYRQASGLANLATWASGDGAGMSLYIATNNHQAELRVADSFQTTATYIYWDASAHSSLRDELVEGVEFALVVGDSTEEM